MVSSSEQSHQRLVSEEKQEECVTRERRHTFFGNMFYRLYKEDKQAVIHAVMELEQDLDDEKLAEILEKELMQFPRFKCTLDDKNWIPIDVKGIDMIQHETFPGVNPQLELEAFIGKNIVRRFADNMPHWEVIKVHYEGQSRVDLLWRISHCVGDGITLSTVLMSLTDAIGEAEPSRAVSKRPQSKTSTQVLTFLFVAVAVAAPIVFGLLDIDGISSTAKTWIIVGWVVCALLAFRPSRVFLKAVNKVNMLSLGPSDSRSLLHGPKPKFGGEKVVATLPPISVEEMKAAARPLGCTLNDVVMSMVSGGLRRYLLSKNDPAMQRCLPLTVRSMGLVNLRAVGVNKEKLLNEYRTGDSGNDISYFTIGLDVSDKTASDRLEHMGGVMKAIKYSPEGHIMLFNNRVTGKIIGMKALTKLGTDVAAKCTTLVSNLAGPASARSLGGVRINRIYNTTAPMGFGVQFNLLSYNGYITVSAAGDKETLGGTPAEVLACVLEEYNALQAELTTV